VADPLTDARVLARRWHDHLAQGRRRSPHTVRAYTATAYRLIDFLSGHLGGPVDARGLSGLAASDLRAFLARRRRGGR
jgi:integrase/recombinase XerC